MNTHETTTENALLGGWDLLRHERVDLQGNHRSTGEEVKGKLIYSADGSLAVVITKKQQPPLAATDISCYAGKFTFDGTHVHHHVSVSNRLERLGATLTRSVTLSGDVLILQSKPDADGYFKITWTKTR